MATTWRIILCFFFICPTKELLGSERPPSIAAASSLHFALQEVSQAFTQKTGHALRISYGSSGNLARQIRQGGPFELFLSADQDSIKHLVDAGLTRSHAVIFVTGRLVLYSSLKSKLKLDANLLGLKQAITDGKIKRFSIANPEHAPYGKAAKQVLQTIKLWTTIQPHLVFGENVAQATQFASQGAAQGGIIAYSFVLNPSVKSLGRFVLIPQHLHQPVKQSMVLLKNAGETAKLFFDYLQQPASQDIFARAGFEIPCPQ